MKYYYKSIDFIQWVWKSKFDIDKSKSQIRRDIEQGSVKLNERKISIDDVFEIEDNIRACKVGGSDNGTVNSIPSGEWIDSTHSHTK